MGGVGNGAAEENWLWDLNSGLAAMQGFLGDRAALGYSLLPRELGCRRDFSWKKRGERTLAGGP